MALTYTADEIIESVRNLGMVPDAGTLGGEDEDILRHANEEISLTIVPELIRTREDYLVVTTRTELVSNTLKYRIPNRAIGEKLRYVRWIDSSGDRSQDILQLIDINHQGDFNWSSSSKPEGYYLEGNYICLVGSDFSGYLEMSWYFRPGQLVLSSNARQITAVSTSLHEITCYSNIPESWSPSNKFDIHSKESGAEVKIWGETATSVGGTGYENKIQFLNEIDGSTFGTHPVEVGDWVCLEKEAAVPAIPLDLHPLLVRVVSMRMCEAQGDVEKTRMEHDLLKEAKENTASIYKNRAGRVHRIKGCKGMLWRQG